MKPKLEPGRFAKLVVPASTRPRIVEIVHITKETAIVRMVPTDPQTEMEFLLADLIPVDHNFKWVHFAEVNWDLIFPEDMLRYDHAALCDCNMPEDKVDCQNVLIYKLGDTKEPKWTYDRWRSFGAVATHLRSVKRTTK